MRISGRADVSCKRIKGVQDQSDFGLRSTFTEMGSL